MFSALKYIVVLLIVGGLVTVAYYTYSINYNNQIRESLTKYEKRLGVELDSVCNEEVKYKELKRIQELSFRLPITKEHLRGEKLRDVIEGMQAIEVWKINKLREINSIRELIKEAEESYITF